MLLLSVLILPACSVQKNRPIYIFSNSEMDFIFGSHSQNPLCFFKDFIAVLIAPISLYMFFSIHSPV